MDIINMSLEDASLIREMASWEPVPSGTDSASQFEILKDYIYEFEKTLDSEHEVGMLLTNFGQNILLQVTHVGYEYPSLMVFKGYVNGKYSTLIQHINQLSFLLTSVEKEPERPKRRIGFVTEE
ncbi:MAG: hypothetical protein J6J79_11435 [Lachnospiraceae bacterium]|nr:hypothetical protein [Lachnospiraceae bacterium]